MAGTRQRACCLVVLAGWSVNHNPIAIRLAACGAESFLNGASNVDNLLVLAADAADGRQALANWRDGAGIAALRVGPLYGLAQCRGMGTETGFLSENLVGAG